MSLTPTEQEVRAFVGPNADYYLAAWRRALAGEDGASGFNVGGFFLAVPWLAYRKMYAAALILVGIIIAESVLEEALFAGAPGEMREPSPGFLLLGALRNALGALVVGIVIGIGGNRWYLARARRVIEEVRSQGLPEEAHLKALSGRGGTSLGASLGLVGLAIVAVLVLGTILG
jgi:hypothetical protein